MVLGRTARADAEPARSMVRGRVIGVRVLAVVALVTACFLPVFAAFDASSRVGEEQVLEPPGSPEAEYGAAHPSEAVHLPSFVAMTVLAAAGLVGLIVDPRRAGSATHAMAVGVGMAVAAFIAGDPDNHGGQGLVVDPLVVGVALPVLAAAAAAIPWREWRSGGLRRPSLLWFAAAALPLVWVGIEQALLQRNTWPPLADPHHQTHWLVMAQLALAVPLVTAGASLSGRGWRVATLSAGLGVLALVIPALFYTEAASAVPTWSAALGIVWAAALLTASLRERTD
jgi:hypothetical protein